MNRRNMLAALVLAGGLMVAIGVNSNESRAVGANADDPPARATEARIMKVIDKLTPEIGPMLSVPPEDGKLLRLLAESTGAKHVAEIGTSNGYSGLWLCMGLKNTGGKLTTFELDAEKVKLARAHFKEAGVDDIATVIEGDAHEQIKQLKAPLDLVFIDAEKEGYLDYLKQVLPLVRPGGLILAHNTINTRGPLKPYIEAVTNNPDLVTVFANTSDRGMSVSMKKPPAK